MKSVGTFLAVVIISSNLMAQENYEMSSGHMGSGANSNQQFKDRGPKAVKNRHDRPEETAAILGVPSLANQSKETKKRLGELLKQKFNALARIQQTPLDSADGKLIDCQKCNSTGLAPCNHCLTLGFSDCRTCGSLGSKPCVACDGVGAISGLTCNVCAGKGFSSCRACEGKGKRMCLYCIGVGYVSCHQCEGAGKYFIH